MAARGAEKTGVRFRLVQAFLLGLALAFFGGCPVAHDKYETSRSCDENQDCTKNEVCAAWDAGTDGGWPRKLCYETVSLTYCEFPDAGVSYWCFEPGMNCVYRRDDAGAFGCEPSNRNLRSLEGAP